MNEWSEFAGGGKNEVAELLLFLDCQQIGVLTILQYLTEVTNFIYSRERRFIKFIVLLIPFNILTFLQVSLFYVIK